MKMTLVALIIVCISTGVGAFAAPASDPSQDIRDAQTAGSQAAARAISRRENEARLRQVFRSMAREMEMLESTEDVGERQRLMRMHGSHLHETMMLLRVIGGDSLQRVIADHTPIDRPPATEPGQGGIGQEQRLAELEKRMDMLQMLIESMLDHLTMPGDRR